jgi:hypothetical protein
MSGCIWTRPIATDFGRLWFKVTTVGMGGHAPRRVAVQPPLPPSRGARVIVGGEDGIAPARLLGAAGPRIYVNASMPELAATSEGVTPVSVRLSPCVSWIVRPDELLVAWDMTAARSSACVMPGVR